MEYRPIVVRAKLKNVFDKERMIYKRLGGLVGDTISRVFVVPDDIQLWALHYVTNAAFGLLDGHLHAFSFTDEDMEKLTGNSASKWAELVGLVFRPPEMDPFDLFSWYDDYDEGDNYKAWRKRKYSGPYVYCGKEKRDEKSYREFKKLWDDEKELLVIWSEYKDFEYVKGIWGKNEKVELKEGERSEIVKLKDFDKFLLFNFFETNYSDLAEFLTVREIYEKYAKSLVYEYDYGDGWEFSLEFSYEDIPYYAEERVMKKHAPYMLQADGLNLVEDVGGTRGFATFLIALYGRKKDIADFSGLKEEDVTEDAEGYGEFDSREDALDWAEGLEWSEKKIPLDKML